MKFMLLAGLLVAMIGVASAGIVHDGLTDSGVADAKTLLDEAIADERRAIAFYAAVMEHHGEKPPFANIIEAERRHETALLDQYRRLGLTPPSDPPPTKKIVVAATFAEACDASIVAEIRNGRMYDRLIAATTDAQLREVFERLRTASVERHLPAFQRHGSGWKSVAADALSPTHRRQVNTAMTARGAMFGSVLSELGKAMSDGGPAAGVDVCSTRAPEIAREAARQHGVRIGRTSWKLRNPASVPPPWAAIAVDERRNEQLVFADRSGRLGLLSPIRIMSMCLPCHGDRNAIAPEVAAALAEHYPDDHATGFANGDLRGWFWIEVPKPSTGSEGAQP